jgi:hypothetical protein
MSVNRNVNIIKAVQPIVEREPISYNFSASLWAIGGGGGGEDGTASNTGAGGGGGAAAVVSSSISIVPNITWTIEVGEGGSANLAGENTTAIVYDVNYDGLVTLRAQGGRPGNNAIGGNSGTGSVETIFATSSYSAFTGGTEVTGGGRNSAGGGAGANGNGGTGTVFDGNPGTGVGGVGGIGLGIFGGVAGGGGGGIGDTVQGGTALQGGGYGGLVLGTSSPNGEDGSKYGAGGGGGLGHPGIPGTGGAGYKGAVILSFVGRIGTELGEYDITTTNASSSFNGGTTTIFFESGSGTFRYTAPFPYVPGN